MAIVVIGGVSLLTSSMRICTWYSATLEVASVPGLHSKVGSPGTMASELGVSCVPATGATLS